MTELPTAPEALPPTPAPKSGRAPWEAVLAVALVAFTLLAAEVAITRIFSVLFRAPYVFLIVSGAIGGLGLGGLLVQSWRGSDRLSTVGLCLGYAVSLALPVLLLFALPWGRDLVSQAETAVVVLLPMITFCAGGVLLSLLLRRHAEDGGFLYFIDLAAAAVAAPVAVLLLDTMGGINTPLALAVLGAAAALVLAVRGRRTPLIAGALVVTVALAVVFGSNLASRWIDLPTLRIPAEARDNPSHPWHQQTKPLYAELADPYTASRIVRTDWTSVSRTDVVQEGDVHYVYTDGDVPTQMEAWDGDYNSARRDYAGFIGSLPYRLLGRSPERVMAIGSGGGLDVLLAKAAGAQVVDAIEINPSIPKVVADPRFAGTYARVYREPGVRLLVDEGRSFLQRVGKYDVIYFACAKTATTQTGGVALLDNHLYTVEAFRDYWRHLSDGGVTALVTQENVIIDRLLITALAALRLEGISAQEAANHLITARVPVQNFPLGPYRHILILSRKAFTPEQMANVDLAIRTNGLESLYLPHIRPGGANGGVIDATTSLEMARTALEGQYKIGEENGLPVYANLAPVTDDSPFYVDFSRGLHPFLTQLLWGSVIASGLVSVLTALFGRRLKTPALSLGAGIFYFALLGTGFMLVELALMQRFILLLGFPTRSLTVTLFALLVSGALGSWLTQRGSPEAAAARLRLALPALVALLIGYRFLLPPLLTALLPLPLPVRILATALLLFPAGLLMGMALPTALRSVRGPMQELIPAFWAVNGVTSILGSVLTMAIAKFAGYGTALLLGAAIYFVAIFVFPLLSREVGRARAAA